MSSSQSKRDTNDKTSSRQTPSSRPDPSRPVPSIHHSHMRLSSIPEESSSRSSRPVPSIHHSHMNLPTPQLSRAGPAIDALPSLLTTERDRDMASRQLSHSTLPSQSRAQNDQWYLSLAPTLTLCPESYIWVAVEGNGGLDGGYMCEAGGHGQTREMIAEGKGALCVLEPRGDWRGRVGPYYPVEGKVEFVRGRERRVFVYREREVPFVGVEVPAKYRK